MEILSAIIPAKKRKKKSQNSTFYFKILGKIIGAISSILLSDKNLKCTYYNWLIFLVNLQHTALCQQKWFNYNWLIFLVNLQHFWWHRCWIFNYNWLIFLVNLQPTDNRHITTENYNWLIFLVNLQLSCTPRWIRVQL